MVHSRDRGRNTEPQIVPNAAHSQPESYTCSIPNASVIPFALVVVKMKDCACCGRFDLARKEKRKKNHAS